MTYNMPNGFDPTLPQSLPNRTLSPKRPTASSSSTHQRQTSAGRSGGTSPNDLSNPPKERSKRRPTDSNGNPRLCGKCGQQLLGQFVRALGDTFHLECFTCQDCGKVVASKFFPIPEQPPNQQPLCETDYFRRLDLLCHSCGGALRGSYITALDRKYHIEHFTCSLCPTVFGAQDSYYEHDGLVYCHYHYSTKFAQKCNGCSTAILQQFVEIFRNGQNQHWHPECYMIHKYWNVRLHQGPTEEEPPVVSEADATTEMRKFVKDGEQQVEEKVMWIWRTLSSFEEKSASSISDMLLHVSNGSYVEGVTTAKKFILHVDVLFGAADSLDTLLQDKIGKGLSYAREAKLLCRKVISFFQLLSASQDTGIKRLGVTQELLSLVTGLAHYLKLLIRICLQGALKYERETSSAEGLNQFLCDIGTLDQRLEAEEESGLVVDRDIPAGPSADLCAVCGQACEDRSFKRRDVLIHAQCFTCTKCSKQMAESPTEAIWNEPNRKLFCERHGGFSGGKAAEGRFVYVSRLRQYIYLLRIAHARLLSELHTSGTLKHTSDAPIPGDRDYGSRHRFGETSGQATPPLLRNNDTRSKSYAPGMRQEPTSSYEQTLGDIRRLRSTRMDRQLSQTNKKARTSTIIDAPNAMRPGSPDAQGSNRPFQIIEDRETNGGTASHLSFGNADAMTLDDIPRLVQAQQTREQRPNASKYARTAPIPQEPRPKLVNGHARDSSGGKDDKLVGTDAARTKRYFSELSALEYFVVRAVAVLYLEPLLDGLFNQEELLELIEPKRPTFWGKFGKAFKNDSKNVKGKKKGVFDVPIEQLVERDYYESTDGVGPISLRIPSLVHDSITAMRTMDMSVEGVFRKNGNIGRLNSAKEKIDNNGEVDFMKENPVQVAALLKKFLRDLPDPLMTTKLYKLWIASQRITDDSKRRRVLHLTCCLLPKAQRDTMEVLFAFLAWASSFSQVDEESGSKMDIHNLATVIAPNILRPPLPASKKDAVQLPKKDIAVDDSLLAIEVVNTLIEFNEVMCEIPEDLPSIINDSSLFGSSGDISTKEILKRYGDRVPSSTVQITSPGPASGISANSPHLAGIVDESGNPAHASSSPRSREGVNKTNPAPVATRVDPDPTLANAWSNEASVRHVRQAAGPGGSFFEQAMTPNSIVTANPLGGSSGGMTQQWVPAASPSGPNSGFSTPRLPYSAGGGGSMGSAPQASAAEGLGSPAALNRRFNAPQGSSGGQSPYAGPLTPLTPGHGFGGPLPPGGGGGGGAGAQHNASGVGAAAANGANAQSGKANQGSGGMDSRGRAAAMGVT